MYQAPGAFDVDLAMKNYLTKVSASCR